jgi:hypothetical protein
MSAPQSNDVDALTAEVKRLKDEIARLKDENEGLSDMIRAGGAPRGARGSTRFLAGVGVGLLIAYATMLVWSHEQFGAPFIKMF